MTDTLHVSNHPLVQHKLSVLRDENTDHRAFRELVRELALLLVYEATLDLKLEPRQVKTPMGMAQGYKNQETIGLVPVLRAGLGMVEGALMLLPSVQVWHIGLYRDEHTLRPVEYYNRLPEKPTVQVCLVLDPMLATGGSAAATIDILKRWGVPAHQVRRADRRAGRRRASERAASRRADPRGGGRRSPERGGLHRAGAGGCRGSPVRDMTCQP